MPVSFAHAFARGIAGKCNHVLARPSEICSAESRVLVFFPGDITDFAGAASCEYRFSLEGLAWTLSLKFPSPADALVLVRAFRVENQLALYGNFLPLIDALGQPRNNEPGPAMEHLTALLDSLDLGPAQSAPRVICGFSKGGVVLSALLRSCAEMHCWQKISELHFL